MADSSEKFVLYHYNPSLAAAVIFIILFFATAILHSFQLFKNRTWYFIPFLIGGFFEPIGYIGRAISSKESPNWTVGPYICQSLLLLLAPTLFAASIYMILGRIIRLTDGEEYSPIRARWLTKVFVAGDVLSFLAQSGGGGMLSQAKTAADQKRGTNIITGGLFIQVIFFGCFMVVSVVFHTRMARAPAARSFSLQVPWKKYLFVLYIASTFIMVRSVFRIAEYLQGNDGSLLQTETYLYLFDATLMFLTMVLFNVFHPSKAINYEYVKNDYSTNRADHLYGESVGMASRGLE